MFSESADFCTLDDCWATFELSAVVEHEVVLVEHLEPELAVVAVVAPPLVLVWTLFSSLAGEDRWEVEVEDVDGGWCSLSMPLSCWSKLFDLVDDVEGCVEPVLLLFDGWEITDEEVPPDLGGCICSLEAVFESELFARPLLAAVPRAAPAFVWNWRPSVCCLLTFTVFECWSLPEVVFRVASLDLPPDLPPAGNCWPAEEEPVLPRWEGWLCCWGCDCAWPSLDLCK